MIYLDTSALVKLYVLEAGSEFVQSCLSEQDDPLPVWELQEAELANALHLKVFRNEWTEAEAELQIEHFHSRKQRGLYVFPEIDRVELIREFHRLSRETPRTGCRTMDIFHVACALQIPLCRFLTFDGRQGKLARMAGLEMIEVPENSAKD
ncbi:MAG: type II toxin-antitoxin system VapC family toxin [Verrucomicrobiales bacterium]|nr:type II toxin-antitoxin system VapC family toxin [Verrucomicrobiales bacterium]